MIDKAFQEFKQEDVDFVIPRTEDLRLGIDPFLLFKSRHLDFKNLHDKILGAFNEGVRLFKQRGEEKAKSIIDFPEVEEIGFGYGKKNKKGSGLGLILNQLLFDALASSPALLDRGVKHIEEMQLVSLGIGADRVSDIAANILKEYLIEYTQGQCSLWNIPIKSNVPISHILDLTNYEWYDDYFNLPVNENKEPILLVPRRIVRLLPWINFDDYRKSEFSLYLRAKVSKQKVVDTTVENYTKERVIAVTRTEVERIDHYVKKKERDAKSALPANLGEEASKTKSIATSYIGKLRGLPIGRESAVHYQKLMLEILNFLFEPDLIDGKPEVRTILGTERRDLIFVNDSDKTFFEYLRNNYKNFLIVFEAKNVEELTSDNYNQMATYLGDKTGFCGFILTRKPFSKSDFLKAIAIYNNMKRVIITISDEDVVLMCDMREKGNDPMRHLQNKYREFKQAVQ